MAQLLLILAGDVKSNPGPPDVCAMLADVKIDVMHNITFTDLNIPININIRYRTINPHQ